MSKPLDELKSVLAEDTRNFSDSSVSHWTSIMKEYELIQLGNAANGGKRKNNNNRVEAFKRGVGGGIKHSSAFGSQV